jgi:hypothetical protein
LAAAYCGSSAFCVQQVVAIAPVLNGAAQLPSSLLIDAHGDDQPDQQIGCGDVEIDLGRFVEHANLYIEAFELEQVRPAVGNPTRRRIRARQVHRGDFDAGFGAIAGQGAATQVASLQTFGARTERKNRNQSREQHE